MNQKNAFSSMLISDGMKTTIANVGYTDATAIQTESIPHLLSGRDFIGQAQTGTGKTAAFGIPVIEMVDDAANHPQALLVCPTRELCLQVTAELVKLSAHKHNLNLVAIYGGQGIEKQLRDLRVNKPQIIVATPGRLFDHLRRKSIELSKVSMIILDEADKMLDMGFRPEIEEIFTLLPQENQRIFFSATMPKAIKDLACTYLRNPILVKAESKSLTATKIEQTYLKIRPRDKTELLCRILDHKDPKLAVVFCNAKSTADEIVEEIKYRGFDAGVLHGDLSQNARDKVMDKFRSESIRVLVATDIASRGIDVDGVELVINYHLPQDPEDYVHRIGRTGRAGRFGQAISLVEPRDNSRLRKIMSVVKVEIKEQAPPSLNDIKLAKISNLFAKVKKAIDDNKISQYQDYIKNNDMDLKDFAAGMVHLSLEKTLSNNKEIDSCANDFDKAFSANKRGYSRSDSRGGFSDRRGGERGGDRDRGGDRGYFNRGGDRDRNRSDSRGDSRGGDRRFGRGFGGADMGNTKPAPSFKRDGDYNRASASPNTRSSDRPGSYAPRSESKRPSFNSDKKPNSFKKPSRY